MAWVTLQVIVLTLFCLKLSVSGLNAADHTVSPETYIRHQRLLPSLFSSSALNVFSSRIPTFSGLPAHGLNAMSLHDQHKIKEWSEHSLFPPIDYEALGDYLAPENISLHEQHRLSLELEQLRVREQLFETGGVPDSGESANIYLSMFSGQFRAVVAQSGLSGIDVNIWLNSLLDSLLRLCMELLLHSFGQTSALASLSLVMAATGGSGGDDPDDKPLMKFFYVNATGSSEFHPLPSQSSIERKIRKKLRLLESLWVRLQRAIADGNRDLTLILRDRLMVIHVDMNNLLPLLSQEFLQVRSQPELERKLQTFKQARQVRKWLDPLDSSLPAYLTPDQFPGKQSPRIKEEAAEKNRFSGDGEGATERLSPHSKNKRSQPSENGRDQDSQDNGDDRVPKPGQKDRAESVIHSRNHDNCPLCETQICSKCECDDCLPVNTGNRAAPKASAAGYHSGDQKQSNTRITVMALVTGVLDHQEQTADAGVSTSQTIDVSTSGELDCATSKQTKRAVKSMKGTLQHQLGLHGELKPFFGYLGLSSYQYFAQAWHDADTRGLLTVKNILKSLFLMGKSELIDSLLPYLNLSFPSLNDAKTLGGFDVKEFPDLYFDDEDVESDDSFSDTTDCLPLQELSLGEREKLKDKAPASKKQKEKPYALTLLKKKGPEQAEAYFRHKYEINEQEQGQRAFKALELIKYYCSSFNDQEPAGRLFADLAFKVSREPSCASTEMELVLIERHLPNIHSVADLKQSLAAMYNRSVANPDNKITLVMSNTAGFIKDFCRDLIICPCNGGSLLDILAWGAGMEPIELVKGFIDQLADTLLSENIGSLIERLLTMEQCQSENSSMLLSQIFQSKFQIYTASPIKSLQFKLRGKNFNPGSKQSICDFFQDNLWKDEQDELSVIVTAGYIRLPVVVIYPTKEATYSGIETITGFAMDANMYFTTDFNHKKLEQLFKTFSATHSRPPLLLFRINNKWLGAIGDHLEAYSGLCDLCQEFYSVKDLRVGIYVHQKKEVKQIPNARLMFSHNKIYSSVVLEATENITPEMYQLFLVLNAIHIDNLERFNFDALVKTDNDGRDKPESAENQVALALWAEDPLVQVEIQPEQARDILARANARWFNNRQQSAAVSYPSDTPEALVAKPAVLTPADKLGEAIQSLLTQPPNLDRVISALAEAEILYSEFTRAADFVGDSVSREFDFLYQKASSHPMVRLRQLSISSWNDIMVGFICVEQIRIMQQAPPADGDVQYVQNEELESLQDQLLTLGVDALLKNQQRLIHFLALFSQALPTIEAAKFQPLAATIGSLLSGKEHHLRLLQLQVNQLASKALMDAPQATLNKMAIATRIQASDISVVDSTSAKALLMQKLLASRGYANSALLTDEQLQELSEDLGMAPLLHFLTDRQFHHHRQQVALQAASESDSDITDSEYESDSEYEADSEYEVDPESKTGRPREERGGEIIGQSISTQQTRALVPVELTGQDEKQLIFHQADSSTRLQATASQPLALLMHGRITAAELVHSSRPLRRALIHQKLKDADREARSNLMGRILDRLTSRDIKKSPEFAGIKDHGLPPTAFQYKKTEKPVKALPAAVPTPDLHQFEEARMETPR